MSNENLSISAQDVTLGVNESAAIITSPSLVNALIQDQNKAIETLGKIATVSINDLTIDPLGRVVVQNADFLAALKTQVSHEAMDTDVICGIMNFNKCGQTGGGG